MPPLKSVIRLEKICTLKIADHLFTVFSSWYKCRNVGHNQDVKKSHGSSPNRDFSKSEKDSTYNDNAHAMEVDNYGSKNYTFMKVMSEEEYKNVNSMIEDDDIEPLQIYSLTPVPCQHQTFTQMSEWCASKIKDFFISHLAPRFYEEILGTQVNMIAQKVAIPRPKAKLRDFEEDLEFINTLGFLLRVSLSCLLIKGVTSLDLSSVAHLVKKWKLLCWGGETVSQGKKNCQSPYFDIFSYAFDLTLPGVETLRYLKLPHFVHNTFVHKVSFLCPNLEVLILRCSADCSNPKHTASTVTNLEILCGTGEYYYYPDDETLQVRGCKNLNILELPEGVDRIDVVNEAVEMLNYMPDLQRFVGAPMIRVAEELEEIFDTELQSFKLTNFHHGAYGKSNWPFFVYDALEDLNLDNLSTVFCQVKEVGIYAPAQVTAKVLMSFPKAQDITIFTDDFEIHGKYLKNLMILDINIGYQMVWPILSSVSHTSPNLEQLTMRSFSLQFTDSDDPRIMFPCLQTLRFQGQNVLEGNALIAVLKGCPDLSTFVLSMITDEDGDSQLDDAILQQAIPFLSNIQKFVYKVQSALRTADGVPSSLTIGSCRALISACPHLTSIGQLETWKVTRSEIDVLQEQLRAKNWDLELG